MKTKLETSASMGNNTGRVLTQVTAVCSYVESNNSKMMIIKTARGGLHRCDGPREHQCNVCQVEARFLTPSPALAETGYLVLIG